MKFHAAFFCPTSTAEMQENIQHGSIWLKAAAQLPHQNHQQMLKKL